MPDDDQRAGLPGIPDDGQAGRPGIPEDRRAGRLIEPDDDRPPRRARGPDGAARARLAAEALAAARADSLARGNHPAPPGSAPGSARHSPVGGAAGSQPAGARSQPAVAGQQQAASAAVPPRYRRRPRRDDPQPLNSAIDGLIDEQGWRLAAATGSVFGRWAQIVGPELAAHTTPEGLADGELTVAADSTAWATQVRLLAAQLVRRLNAELGDGAVKRVKVRGPAAPRQAGQWRVRGARGPRDTYG
ncbi:MAG: DciA family protein [Streptosporangiaceae bacterium]